MSSTLPTTPLLRWANRLAERSQIKFHLMETTVWRRLFTVCSVALHRVCRSPLSARTFRMFWLWSLPAGEFAMLFHAFSWLWRSSHGACVPQKYPRLTCQRWTNMYCTILLGVPSLHVNPHLNWMLVRHPNYVISPLEHCVSRVTLVPYFMVLSNSLHQRLCKLFLLYHTQ